MSAPAQTLTLPGKSRRIRVEPLKLPGPARDTPAPAPRPKREPEWQPARQPEREPARS